MTGGRRSDMEKSKPEKELKKAKTTIHELEGKLEETASELARTNTDLLQLTVELEDRVAARTAELREALTSIEREKEEHERAYEKLLESESRARAITQAANDAIIQIDNEGKVIYWNPAAETMFKYSSREATGKDVVNLIVPERMRADHKKAFNVFKETGRGRLIGNTVEISSLNKDGGGVPDRALPLTRI